MQASIEIRTPTGIDLLAVLPAVDQSHGFLELTETSSIRISVTGYNETTKFLIGLHELQAYEKPDGSSLIFASSDLAAEKLAQFDFFSAPFRNQIGRSTLCLEHDGETFQIDVKLDSPKVDETEVSNWIEKICEEFPVFDLPSLMTPISEIGARKNERVGFKSLLSFIKEANTLVDGVNEKVDAPRYLKTTYQRRESTNGNLLNRSAMHSSSWVKPGIRWKPISINGTTIVKKGLKSFEPEKYPSLSGLTSYSSDLNTHLMETLIRLATCCREYNRDIKKKVFEIQELRTQFGSGNSAKFNLFKKYIQEVDHLERKVDALVHKLSALGVQRKQNIESNAFDNRYRQLCIDISDLELCSRQFAKYKETPNTFLGILGLDFIFEFFVFAQLISTVRRLGLKLVDANEGFPLNTYFKFEHKDENYGIRILFDFEVPKYSENQKNFPIWDHWTNNERMRPDFILHLFTKGYEEVVILDAKYKTIKKCESDFNSFRKPESLVVKYGTKLFLSGSNKLAASYVGAICCHTNSTEPTIHKWMTQTNDQELSLSQTSGITSLNSSDDSQLYRLISEIVDKFKQRSIVSPDHETSETSRVESGLSAPEALLKKYERGMQKPSTPKRSINHTNIQRRDLSSEDRAKTLSLADASIVKGMLARGDIPQHIAQYFGVNNGRISDIKHGNTFSDATPAPPDQLPRPGPYPSLEYLIKAKPDLAELFMNYRSRLR